MRITNKFLFEQNTARYQRMQNDIDRANNKNIDERRFHQSYDDSSSYSETVRLDNEIASLERVHEAAERAVSLTKNSDNAMNEMSKELDIFKVKLLQAANEVHSSTSLNAIANDLQQIRNHIVNVANTSLNGQFLFSGTAINTKPFDDEGNYHGNDENMKVLLGSKVSQNYNISGAELFKGRDNDYRKVISSNVRMMDQRYDVRHPDEVHYLTLESKIRDMVGKNYAKNPDDLSVTDNFFGHEHFPPTHFYVSGTRGNGESFRASFSMKDDENISAMLKHIGEIYGNTDENELVKVELTKSGTIEITDLANDSSRLNFAMFAATERRDVEDLKKDFDAEQAGIKEANEQADLEYQNRIAKSREDARAEAIAAGLSDEEIQAAVDAAVPESTPAWQMSAPLDMGKSASLAQLQEREKAGLVHLLNFCDNANKPFGEADDAGLNYARAEFGVKDQFLRSNIVQYRHDGAVASDADTLMSCSAAPIETDLSKPHTVLNADIKSRGGVDYHLRIDLSAGFVEWDEPGKLEPGAAATAAAAAAANGGNGEAMTPLEPAKITRRIDFTQKEYNQRTHENYRRKSGPEEITFAQLNGMLELFASDNVPPHDLLADEQMPPEQGVSTQFPKEVADEFDALLDRAKTQLSVHLKDGRMQLEDSTTTTTKVRMSIYDSLNGSEEFAINGAQKPGDVFTFSTNSSLVIDHQQLDVIKDLDAMIEAVRAGEYRSDNAAAAKNPGIQAAVRRLDHIADHLRKSHTKIGAAQNAIEAARDRCEVMQLNITEVKNNVMGNTPSEKAKALMEITSLMGNFQAVLQTSAMINKLSLLDYMR